MNRVGQMQKEMEKTGQPLLSIDKKEVLNNDDDFSNVQLD